MNLKAENLRLRYQVKRGTVQLLFLDPSDSVTVGKPRMPLGRAKDRIMSLAILVICLLAALPLASCISVPPVPLDGAAAAHRLTERSLDDAAVADALTKAGIAAGDKGWSVDALTVAAWTLKADVAAAAIGCRGRRNAALRTVAGELPNPTVSLDPGYLTDNANNNLSPWSLAAAIGFTIETGDKRAIRKDQAQAEVADALRWRPCRGRCRRCADALCKTCCRLQLARETLGLAEEEARLRRAFSAWVENAFKFGAVAQPDRLKRRKRSLALAGKPYCALARGDMAAADAPTWRRRWA